MTAQVSQPVSTVSLSDLLTPLRFSATILTQNARTLRLFSGSARTSYLGQFANGTGHIFESGAS